MTSQIDATAGPSRSAVAMDYARRMFERQRVPLPPLGFQVDWADQPSRHKLYLDAPKLPLPVPFANLPSIEVEEAAARAAGPVNAELPSLDLLASVLGCYGLIDRRTQLNWNEDSTAKLRPTAPVWARPTASGGGMYPAESYLVAGSQASLRSGVYHYDTAHHSLDRLSSANRCAELAAATGVEAGLYLVATLKFWKNAFKYNSFSYHVVAQDVGALLASWRLVFAAAGHTVEPVLWFDEDPVSTALAVDGRTEAPFVVVPLGPSRAVQAAVQPGTPPQLRVWEKSERVRDFELAERVHAAALVGEQARPTGRGADLTPVSLDRSAGVLPLPAPGPSVKDLTTSLCTRRSSFGLFSSRPRLSTADLGSVLETTARMTRAGSDVEPAPRQDPWTRLWVLPNAVDGLEKRAYAYDPTEHQLIRAGEFDYGEVQRHYALTNYNISEVAAVLVITGRLEALVEAYGARGYRMLSVEVGQLAQTSYLAATARGLGIGAVLGIDNLAVDEFLGIGQTDERSMLFLLLGHERAGRAGYDHGLHHRPAQGDLR
ncbi:SagB family peptide dehydrogenase [Kribbella sp. CA-293567]|uniref:SagB family peptide dehydrogenase n=1 Tax=Kribbella sp. CA-293567 TaxID=3002436 RepID=UPI0022DD5C9C|nr:SagB family peptide dehydrogenase [Kribbella sp. CA-293567]WBQ05863.1 SagB family peptide dehydrogenase [Kribbella sp. CA-293567]